MAYKSSSYQMTVLVHLLGLSSSSGSSASEVDSLLLSPSTNKRSSIEEGKAQKATHWVLQLISLISGILGIYAAFKFHNELHIPNVYTLHSWMGLITISLFSLQWILGFFSFVFPGSSASSRAGFLPWHALLGTIISLTAVCTAEMGIAEKFIFKGFKHGPYF